MFGGGFWLEKIKRKKEIKNTMKCRLTKYEKETIILFNEAEPTANIYIYNKTLQNRLAKFSR